MSIGVGNLARAGALFLANNSTTILTGLGIAGVGATGFLAARAGGQAAKAILEVEAHKLGTVLSKVDENDPERAEKVEKLLDENMLDLVDKAKIVWPYFVPPVLMGAATMGAIFMSHRISAKQLAAMTAAYGLSEQQLKEYKNKVSEKLGLTKAQATTDEIAKERIAASPPNSSVFVHEGDVLFHDMFTGRYFSCTMEKVRRAENDINFAIMTHGGVSASEFYDKVGLPATEMTDMLGWSMNNLLELSFSTNLTQDNRPCISLSFAGNPEFNFHKVHA